MNRTRKTLFTSCAAAAAFGAAMLAAPSPAQAEPVSGSGKGIVGGALLGAEVVTITLGIIGVEDAWPYLVFGAVGAVGGGLGGFAVEQADPPAEVPMAMLTGGMALVIPAVVISLDATSTDPAAESEDEPSDGPVDAEGSFEITAQNRTNEHRRSSAAVHIAPDQVQLGVPGAQVSPAYSQQEVAQFGVEQGAMVQLPVVSAEF